MIFTWNLFEIVCPWGVLLISIEKIIIFQLFQQKNPPFYKCSPFQ